MYLSNASLGGVSPPVHLTLTASLFDLLNASRSPTPMAFDIGPNLPAYTSTCRRSNESSFLEVVLENNLEYSNTLAHFSGFVRRSDRIVGSPRSFRAEGGFGKYGPLLL